MTCVVCGKKELHSPFVEDHGWRCIDIGPDRFYACPDEFPEKNCDKSALRSAYAEVLEKIKERQNGYKN